jgi:hypothetical protein
MARVYTTKIGDTTVADSFQQQQKLINEAYANPKYRPAIDGIVAGFTKLQGELPGSKTLEQPQFAFDEAGYVANRVMTYSRLHANQFDAASPDQAAEMGAKLVEEAKKELAEHPGMKAVGDTLEIDPRHTAILKHHWEGNQLSAGDVAELGVTAARELQRAVTPLEPDATHPQLQWVEDSSAWLLGMWPGAASKTAEALGLKADGAEVEKIVEAWRGDMNAVEPKVVQPLQSLTAILGAAGITANDKAAYDAAFQVLQSSPLEGVPAGIAQSIVGHNKLPPEASDYLAGRIVETTGSPGNIKGLLAEIELMKQPPPVDPPGGPTPPPDGGTPPPGPPNPEPPPGGTTPPPVDPPAGEEPPKTDPPKTDPPKTDPPKTDPPKTDPPAGEEPPKTDPPKTDEQPVDPPKTDEQPVDPPKADEQSVDLTGGDQPILTTTAPATGGSNPMSQEEFDKLLAEVQAEIDAEQGPHPVNQPAAGADAHGHAH